MIRKWISVVACMIAAGAACGAGAAPDAVKAKKAKAAAVKVTKVTKASKAAKAKPAETKPAETRPAAEVKAAEPVFATVDGTAISGDDYDRHLNFAIREKFFHRRPPEDQLRGLRREVGDRMIERILLLAEAKRRSLQPDSEKVRQVMAKFEERNKANPRWQEQREKLLPTLEQEMGDNELVEQIEKIARQTPEPQPEQLRQYYDDHHDAFTEPEKVKLAIILLKVDPGLPREEKAKILEQAKALRARLVDGADFAALAKEYSGDETASKGGDMGYVHRGMLGEEVHKQIEGLAPGGISEPIMLMEGVAILRFDERIPDQLKSLEESRERAVTLWQRETAELQWQQLKASLRKAAAIKIVDPTRYPEAETPKQEEAGSGGSKGD